MNYWDINTELKQDAPRKKKGGRKIQYKSEETRARALANLKRGQYRGGSPHRAVIVFNDDGSYETYPSMKQAAQELSLYYKSVQQCANSNRNYRGGHNEHYAGDWRIYYADDMNWLKKTKFSNY